MKTINYAYVRSATGLDRQKKQIIDFASSLGIDDLIFIQEHPGKIRDRFEKLITMIEDTKPSDVAINLFVYDLDRLSRNEETLWKLLAIDNLNIKIVTLPEFSKDMAPVLLPLFTVIHKEEARRNSTRFYRKEGN